MATNTISNQGGGQSGNSPAPKRIVIFDDSREALKRFVERLQGTAVELRMYRRPKLDDSIREALQKFQPQLIVVGLLMGESREDGYKLIKQLHEVDTLKDVPIVVCSKLINDSDLGRKEKERSLSTPGLVAAYGKIPNFPPAEELFRPLSDFQSCKARKRNE